MTIQCKNEISYVEETKDNTEDVEEKDEDAVETETPDLVEEDNKNTDTNNDI